MAGYDAFISYSHAADGRLGPALEHGLERLARPWQRLRAMSVFRDQSDLPLNSHLWGTIQTALDTARYLIVLASPEAAASEWVNQEARHWCDTKGTDQLLLVVTGGELKWDATRGDFSEDSTAALPALRGRFRDEPLFLDLRWAHDVPDLSLRLSRFRAAVAQLSAPIRGMAPDELEGEDVRLHRRARRLARSAVIALVVLTAVAVVAAIVAVIKRNEADRRTKQALARQLGLEALDLPTSDLDRALLLSLAAAKLDPGGGDDRFRPSRALIGRFAHLDRLLPTGSGSALSIVGGLGLSADGNALAATVRTVDASGTPSTALLRWDVNGALDPARMAVDASSVSFVGTSGDVVVEDGAGALTTIPSSGPRHALAGRAVTADATHERAITVDGATTRLIDVSTGRVLSELPGAAAGPPLLTVREAQVPMARGLTILDARSGGRTADLALPAAAYGPAVRSVVASPSRAHLLVVDDGGASVLDARTGAVLARDPGAWGPAAVDPSGRFAAMGGAHLTVWDLDTAQRVLAAPEPVNVAVWSAGCADAGAVCRLVTAGRSLDVWEPTTPRRVTLADETNALAVAISRDGNLVATAGWGSTVALWRMTPRPAPAGTRVAPSGGLATAFDPASSTLVRVEGQTAEVTRPDQPAVHITVGDTDQVALTAGGSRLLVRHGGSVSLFDAAQGRPVSTPCQGELMAVSGDGSVFATYAVASHVVAVCDGRTNALLARADLGTDITPVAALAVDAGGDIAIGGGTGVVGRYRRAGEQFLPGAIVGVGFSGLPVTIRSLSLTNDWLAAGTTTTSETGTASQAVLWNASAGARPSPSTSTSTTSSPCPCSARRARRWPPPPSIRPTGPSPYRCGSRPPVAASAARSPGCGVPWRPSPVTPASWPVSMGPARSCAGPWIVIPRARSAPSWGAPCSAASGTRPSTASSPAEPCLSAERSFSCSGVSFRADLRGSTRMNGISGMAGGRQPQR